MTSSPAEFRTEAFLVVGPAEIARLQAEARAAEKGRARICLHGGHGAAVQEMVIALKAGVAIAAHRQPKIERKTYCILEGALDLVFFDDDGAAAERFRLDAHGERVLSFPAARWHGCVAVGDAVYVEIIAGPYRGDGTEWRTWTP